MYRIDHENKTIKIDAADKIVAIYTERHRSEVINPIEIKFREFKNYGWRQIKHNEKYATFWIEVAVGSPNNELFLVDELEFIGETEFIIQMQEDFKNILEGLS